MAKRSRERRGAEHRRGGPIESYIIELMAGDLIGLIDTGGASARARCMRVSTAPASAHGQLQSTCVPMSLCSRSAYRVAARCAHADSTLGGAWSTSGVKQRIGIVGQTFAQMTKLFVESVAGGTMGVWQAGRSPPPPSNTGLSNSGTARARPSGRAWFCW